MTASLAAQAPALKAADQRALDLIARFRFIRRTGGWKTASGMGITLDVAGRLQAMHLVRVDRSGPHPALKLTGAGSDVRAVVTARRRT